MASNAFIIKEERLNWGKGEKKKTGYLLEIFKHIIRKGYQKIYQKTAIEINKDRAKTD